MITATLVTWFAIAIAIVFTGLVLQHITHCQREERVRLLAVSYLIAGPIVFETNAFGSSVTLQLALVVGGVVISTVAMLSLTGSARTPLRLAVLIPALVSGVAFFANAANNPSLGTLTQLGRFAPIVYWIAVGLFFAVGQISLSTLSLAFGVALSATAILTPFVGGAARACDIFKCGPFGYIFTGPFDSENFLAKLASFALLIAIFAPRSRHTLVVGLLAAVLLLPTASRTSLFALAAALVFGWLMRNRTAATHRAAMWLLAVAAAIGSWILVSTASAQDFSNRGWIWAQTLRAIGEEVWLGRGVDRWNQLQQIGALPQHFPHNQYLLLLFSGGVVCAAVFMIMMGALGAGWESGPREAAARDGLFFLFSVVGLTEVMWNPSTVDGTAFSVAALLAATAARSQSPGHLESGQKLAAVHG